MTHEDSTWSPLIAHIIFRLDVGGLENGVVNLINAMPPNEYRHAVICLTSATEFKSRITRSDVEVISLNKGEGKDIGMYLRLWSVLRRIRPCIVHTRNLGTLDCVFTAVLAGVAYRVHGEHGREISDPRGENRKNIRIRKICQRFVHRFVPMSADLEQWLVETIGISHSRIRQIYSGVDVTKFKQSTTGRTPLPVPDFADGDHFVIGSVGRLDPIKGYSHLVRAFIKLLHSEPDAARRFRLVIIGEGPCRDEIETLLDENQARSFAWLPGARDDVCDLTGGFDVFVLPSLGEGISNTILEAMATGLPVIASDVGGNPELIVNGMTGVLVPSEDPEALSAAISSYADNQALRRQHGNAGRERVEQRFSLTNMVKSYTDLYDDLARGGLSS